MMGAARTMSKKEQMGCRKALEVNDGVQKERLKTERKVMKIRRVGKGTTKSEDVKKGENKKRKTGFRLFSGSFQMVIGGIPWMIFSFVELRKKKKKDRTNNFFRDLEKKTKNKVF